jgi:hypothetical protein
MDFIRNYGKKFEEGGDTQTQQNSSGSFLGKQLLDAFGRNLKAMAQGPVSLLSNAVKEAARPFAYSIMKQRAAGALSSFESMANGTIDVFSNTIKRENDAKYDYDSRRALDSLYIYGNDLGIFEEAPELVNKGVEYDKYLKSVGRNPKDVKTYKYDIPVDLQFPDFVDEEALVNYIKSDKNKTYAGEYPGLGGILRRMTLDDNGKPVVVNSDLWDFQPKEYTEKYHGTFRATQNPNWLETKALPEFITKAATYLQSTALDWVGTPFIVKDMRPIQYTDVDSYYRNPRKDQATEDALSAMGVLPEVTVEVAKGDYRRPGKDYTMWYNIPKYKMHGVKKSGEDTWVNYN